MTASNRYPARNPDVQSTLLPDGFVVLFGKKTDWAHTLNPVGALAWEYLDGKNSRDDIAAEIAALTGRADIDELKREVGELIASLSAAGLLLESAAVDD